MKALHQIDISHNILLLPTVSLETGLAKARVSASYPTLIICPDGDLNEALSASRAAGFALPPTSYSQLSNDSLRDHWRQISKHLLPDEPYLGREPSLLSRLDVGPTDLPMRWLARQFESKPWSELESGNDIESIVRRAVDWLLAISVTAHFEAQDVTPQQAAPYWNNVYHQKAKEFTTTVSVSLPGVPAPYARRAFELETRSRIEVIEQLDPADTWSVDLSARSDALVERAAIEFVVAHQALGRSGIGVPLPSIPQAAFTALAKLERHFEGHQNGPTVWRLLDQLNQAANIAWTPAVERVVARASKIHAYTNFPIGLLRLPSDSAPLMSRVPIAYRPLIPLTRAIQLELDDSPGIVLSQRCRVLVAECIPTSDPVGVMSRQGWDVSESYFASQGPPVELRRVETLSVEALRAAVGEHAPDILVLSAHGSLLRASNAATILIGDDRCLGPELGSLPPVVILSSCYTAPRGEAVVSTADLLLRQGALAVLGTQVPVNVAHNAMLMVRFFLYIGEVLAGRESHNNLLEAWHRTQASNAVNDVLQGSQRLQSWGMSSAASGRPVIEEFMGHGSTGRLRHGHVYADTEEVLGEIADATGNGPQVRNWFRRPGYVPESLFYLFIGRPDIIYFNDPVQNSRLS
jgi:hypothetical protein